MQKIVVDANTRLGRINPDLYGHFAEHLGRCIYDGFWVPETSAIPNCGGLRLDVAAALQKIHPPVLRWPGGCFADDYHWEDGVGPREKRPRRVNLCWGDDVETNAFGTHEFMRLCQLIGARPYLAGNVGGGSVREMRDWVEYCNFAGDSTRARQRAANGSPEPFRVSTWGVGNENWGCGGHFCPEDYAAEYKRFSTYLHDFPGAPLYLIACGPDGNKPEWTERFFKKLGGYKRIHGYAAHYYCGTAGSATAYSTEQFYELLHKSLYVERLIIEQRALLDRFDPERKIDLIIDEWGTWHPPTPGTNPKHLWQQNTLRDGLVAALSLDVFNRHSKTIAMATIAQTVNVLQALILTQGEQMVLTPTYHVYDMYQHHQGAESLPATFECGDFSFRGGALSGRLPVLAGSASLKEGAITLSVVNPHASNAAECEIEITGVAESMSMTLNELTHPDIRAHNSFAAPETLRPRSGKATLRGGRFKHCFPAASVTVMRICAAGFQPA